MNMGPAFSAPPFLAVAAKTSLKRPLGAPFSAFVVSSSKEFTRIKSITASFSRAQFIESAKRRCSSTFSAVIVSKAT